MPAAVIAPEHRPAVVLHVGMGKTGTTTIQAVFHRSRRALARQGILYPRSPGPRRHARIGLAMQPDDGVPRDSVGWRRQGVSTPGELRPILEDALFREVERRRPEHLLISDEALLRAANGTLANLRELCDRLASTVRVVAYLRRQDEHLCSRYQQVIKREGEVRTLTQRAQALDEVHDFHARLLAWRDIMRPDHLVVRTFEPDRFVDGSLLSDFVAASGLEIAPGTLAEVPARNESLDAETVEVLRILNLHLREIGRHPERDLSNSVIRAVQPHTSGRTLTLPEPALDDFMARWSATNEAVVRDFLPERAGPLFRPGRRSRPTTTEQALPAARLHELLALADLPEAWRAPLGRIVAQEAAPR